jgi:hypothetical protein
MIREKVCAPVGGCVLVETSAAAASHIPFVFVPSMWMGDKWCHYSIGAAVAIFTIAIPETSCHEHQMDSLSLP